MNAKKTNWYGRIIDNWLDKNFCPSCASNRELTTNMKVDLIDTGLYCNGCGSTPTEYAMTDVDCLNCKRTNIYIKIPV